MKKLVAVLFVSFAWISYIHAKDSIDFRINNVPVLKQPKSQDCWATVITMLVLWKVNSIKSDKKYSKKETKKVISQTIEAYGSKWHDLYKNNEGLSIAQKDTLLNQVGFESEPPANHIIEFYIDKLKSEGPLWITTSTEPKGLNSHAKLLIGIKGDMTYENTFFEFIDPLYGKIVNQRAIKFVKEFENEAIYIVQELIGVKKMTWEQVDFRVQIIHW